MSRNTTLNTTTYGYSNITVLNPDWADYTTWGKKSLNQANGNERGLIMFPDITLDLTAEVKSATATAITVSGFPGTVTVGRTFALVYGQMVNINSTLPSGATRNVKFFTNKGANSFAYDESGTGTDPTPNGVCQVCHTQTTHWRSNGTLAGIGVHAGQNGANCVVCHRHEAGFKAEGCNSCHGFPPINNSLGGPDGLVVNDGGTGSESTPGKIMGSVTRRNVVHLFAPKSSAASS